MRKSSKMNFDHSIDVVTLHKYALAFLQYLSKQNLALREVNDSRVKVYEQLEENISELEATNKKLVEEGKEDKSKIKR